MERLSVCEEEVLLVIYNCDEEPDLQMVMNEANRKYLHEWKPQTISTFLTRLVKKGYLNVTRKGRYSYYHPIISKADYRKLQLSELVAKIYDNDTKELVKDLEEAKF